MILIPFQEETIGTLMNPTRRHWFAEESLKYDVVVNNSALWNFHQTLLLKEVWSVWKEKNHKGRIINIGPNSRQKQRWY